MGIKKLKSVVRRLTPIETSRLMGFPDDYLMIGDGKGGSTPDSPMYKACGNSWGVNSARWVNLRIEKILKETGIVKDRTIRYATTCSGVEAHSLSVRGRDWQPYFFSEIEPFPCRVLAARYPNVPNLGDMTKVDGKQFNLDVFSGGTPCQDASVAGKRKGFKEGDDTRSALAYHWIRIGKESGAPILLWENVVGVFSSNGGKDFSWFVHRLTEEGYSVAWRTMDVQWNAVDLYPLAIPQRRRRCWLIAFRGDDWRIPARILFERQDRLGNFEPNRIVNGEIVGKGGEQKQMFVQDDLFGYTADVAPIFDSSSRADFIPWDDLKDLLPVARMCGKVGYAGNIFKGGIPDVENINPLLCENIGNAGVCTKDYIVTMKSPEWSAGIMLPDDVECPKAYQGFVNGLSDVLQPMVTEEDFSMLIKFFLSARACNGIIRRAGKRGKELPDALEKALHFQIAAWANGMFGDCVAADAETEDDSDGCDEQSDECEGEGDSE